LDETPVSSSAISYRHLAAAHRTETRAEDVPTVEAHTPAFFSGEMGSSLAERQRAPVESERRSGRRTRARMTRRSVSKRGEGAGGRSESSGDTK